MIRQQSGYVALPVQVHLGRYGSGHVRHHHHLSQPKRWPVQTCLGRSTPPLAPTPGATTPGALAPGALDPGAPTEHLLPEHLLLPPEHLSPEHLPLEHLSVLLP